MKSFHATPKLKEAVQSFIISQLINREELKKFETAFIEIDTEGDGIISKDELYQQLKKYMSDEEAKTEAEIIISHSDPNHPGYIEYSEFIRAVSDKSVIFSEENLKNTFSLLDIDHNGKISSSELEHLISGENRLDEQLLENLFDQMDPLHKGEISLIDFEESIIHRLQSRKFSTSE